ncbi:uncharacterized protein B0I36DRAFT_364874 [Microdochium trichocladiopsis]|uniref:Nascent polypeptide-associated complex subunit alpha-like UBA domain-containing protein n=1 Tax=Microdochium trichocladiopsis TaxID=1682393 RepID=A0A9P8Y0Q4_9PEZI|nr:uncharacterized protein B0I36DRAFT_364874 [Microdochium trichocladiopsis]KAH7027703.1 hypothetical protein B0I36DRAFT_364874 [Microdochium trichocladiopsis]
MAEPQPPKVKEGATGGDIEDEVQDTTAKSAEDRKAAAALASMDARADDAGSGSNGAVDQEAASKAMKSLGGGSAAKPAAAQEVKKVKVDAADVALLVDELDLTKPKATALLKANDGNAVKAMKAHIGV